MPILNVHITSKASTRKQQAAPFLLEQQPFLSTYLFTLRVDMGFISTPSMLVWAGTELIFFIAASMGLSFGFGMKTTLITH